MEKYATFGGFILRRTRVEPAVVSGGELTVLIRASYFLSFTTRSPARNVPGP